MARACEDGEGKGCEAPESPSALIRHKGDKWRRKALPSDSLDQHLPGIGVTDQSVSLIPKKPGLF